MDLVYTKTRLFGRVSGSIATNVMGCQQIMEYLLPTTIQKRILGLACKGMCLCNMSQNKKKNSKEMGKGTDIHRMDGIPAMCRKQGLMGVQVQHGYEALQIHVEGRGKLKASSWGKPKPQ